MRDRDWITRRVVVLLGLATLALPLVAKGFGPDPFGRIVGGPRLPRVAPAADSCGYCSDPADGMFGVEFKGNELWVLQIAGTLYRLSNCLRLETISIQGFRGAASGLAYDPVRDLFVVTDAELDQVCQVQLQGPAEAVVVNTWPSPSTGPVGAAYDSRRDLYWITDFESGMIQSINPKTGLPGPAFVAPAGSHIAGTAYDATHDVILYNGRFQGETYMISAATGALLDSLAIPGADINSEDLGLAPDGTLWIHQTGLRRVVCVDRSTPVVHRTWGQLKASYRSRR